MISHEIPPLIIIWETLKYLIVMVITKGEISLWVSPTFSESQNPSICRSGDFTNVLPSFYGWPTSVIFLFMVTLDWRFSRGVLLMIATIYWRLHLLTFLSLPLVIASAVLDVDLPLGDSSLSLIPPLTHSASRIILINPSMVSFRWMQS